MAKKHKRLPRRQRINKCNGNSVITDIFLLYLQVQYCIFKRTFFSMEVVQLFRNMIHRFSLTESALFALFINFPLFCYVCFLFSCSADPTQGPLFLARGFSVPDSYYLGSPRTYPRPFCTYSPAIIAHRYNTHNATNAKLDVLHFKCFTSQCTTLDGLSPRDLSTEEQKCYDVSLV